MPDLTTAQATRQAVSAQWALNQLGAQNYFNLCQQFIENAYGTSGQYRSAAAASNALMNNTDVSRADVGDLVFFRPDASNGFAGHVGIYVGNGEMVGATNSGITRDRIDSPYWKNLLVGFGDPPDQWQGRSGDSSLLQGAANLVQRAQTAIGNVTGASQAQRTAQWGGAAQWLPQIAAAAEKYDIPINLLAAKVNVESGGNPNARSPAGAQGLLQLMPGTARALGVTDPNDPVQNLDAGARYFRQMYDQTGDWDDALRAYNAGPNGNWNNTETINHVKKVNQWADTIADAVGTGGGGDMSAGGGGGDRRRGPAGSPNVRKAADLWAGFWQKLEELNEANRAGARAAAPRRGSQRETPPPGGDMNTAAPLIPGGGGAGVMAGITGDTTPPNPPITGSTDVPEDVSRNMPSPTAAGVAAAGAGGPGAPTQRPRPQGYIEPGSITNAAYMGIIGQWNSALEAAQVAQEALSRFDPNDQSDAAILGRRAAQQQLDKANDLIRGLAPTTANIIQAAEREEGGQFAPGTSASQKKFTIVRRNPETGTWETQVIDNPAWEESASVQQQRIANSGALERQKLQDAAALARSQGELASRERVSAGEIASREKISQAELESRESIAGLNATTSRVTTALSAAVQQRSQDIEAAIRAGDLSLREGTEQFNQWYKQNVEAPLAILQQQRETERYKLERETAITQRATARAEHERGIANIGQAMWGQAAQAYNQMIPLTVGDQWGQGFQQNLAAGAGNFTPNQGATYNVPESLDAFATRKVAEMLKGVSPYADSILAAGGQQTSIGGGVGAEYERSGPINAAGMDQLRNTAVGTAQNALNNPFQMPALPQFQLPPQIDITGAAGAGMQNGMALTDELDQYIPAYS